MHLTESLKERYIKEPFSALEAQRMAEFIAFGPIAFQVSRLMLRFGILDKLSDSKEGMTIEEVARETNLSVYAAKCLLEASLSIGTVLVNPDTDRFEISKTGWFLLNDPATHVNLDFNHTVCYEGMFRLEESLREGRPAGLEHFGDWKTVYEALSSFPKDVQDSWFAFDHFFSDSSFPEAMEIVFKNKPKTLLDVGGNTGKWALKCVGYDADVKVTIADLPQQIRMMQENVKGKKGADRILGYGVNLLDEESELPSNHFDVIWMSQFLDCFSEDEVESILRRAASIMDDNTTLYIMETFWDRQRFEAAAMCLTLISLYFTDIANGNSKMFHSDDLKRVIEKVGLQIVEVHDNLGQGHTLLGVKKKN